MEDGDGFIVLAALVVLGMIGFFIFLMIDASSEAEQERKRENYRFEKCIDNGMQWVDDNCIGFPKN